MQKLKRGIGEAIKRSTSALGFSGVRSPRVGTARTPAGMRIYAIGDIHGCNEACSKLYDLIQDDLRRSAPKDYRIVFLGDYVDRGPDSRGVIELVAKAQANDERVIALRGNHEEAMMDFLAAPEETAPFWLTYGGRETLSSYAVTPAYPYDQAPSLERAREALASALPDDHRRMLYGTKLYYRLGDYLFVHAGIDPDRALEAQSPHDLMWMREPFLSHEADLGLVVVHGHTPVGAPDVRTNRINVDTGAVFGGSLSAVVLEGDRQRFMVVPVTDGLR